MTKGPRKPPASDDRAARLKAALRANLGRRKAQGRARADQPPEVPPEDEQHGPQTPNHGAPKNEE